MKYSCTDKTRRILESFALTPERLKSFAVPFYWDLGVSQREEDLSEDSHKASDEAAEKKLDGGAEETASALLKLTLFNWSSYYPLIPVAKGDSPSRWLLIPKGAMILAISSLDTFKNRLLQLIYEQARDNPVGDAKKAKAITKLRAKANRRLEKIAAEMAEQVGWHAATAIEKLDGKLLPGGEIDLLLLIELAGKKMLLLGEVKDFDLAFNRPRWSDHFRQKIEAACDQLDRKVADIRQNLRGLIKQLFGQEVGPDEPVCLLKVLVLSKYLPPFLLRRHPGVPISGLIPFLRQITDEPEIGRLYGHAIEELRASH